MTPARLSVARMVCARLPPVGAQKVRDLIYPRAAAQTDDHRFTVRSRTGSPFSGTTADFVGYPFAVHGYFNWRNIAIATVTCGQGDTIIEVGANIGSETVGFSDIVGPGGAVVAFEPFPPNLDQLRANVAQTRYANVKVRAVALSDHTGHVQFAAPWLHNSGSGHVVAEPGDAAEDVVEVPAATLDSMLPELGAARLLAIDAEGHEVAILGGAREYLRTHQPVVIVEVLEDRLAASGGSAVDVAEQFWNLGYELFEIRRFGIQKIASAVPRASDWVAVPASESALSPRIDSCLRRCALMPMVPRLNPLCA